MCGIVGYIGNKDTKNILLKGLKKLEYRGYDSSGIAVLDQDINIVKTKGKIANLEEKLNLSNISGNIGIGHTRWATHGEPNEVNSHPHFSNDKKIAIVHNGIIENYLELKEMLQKKGYNFISETDTEVIVHLYHSYYDGDMINTLSKVLKDIKGSYAICVICEDHKDSFVVARKDSPLIIGVGENENFIASDVPAILENTKKYYFLDDMEMAIIKKDSVTIFDLEKNIVKKETFEVNWDISLAEKNGYDYFMLKEIFEQPACIKKCISSKILQDDVFFENFSFTNEQINNINKIHIVACGSAWHAGMVGKYIIENMCRIPVELDIASEFRYKNPILNKNDICIIISQSGETADTLAALRLAKENGVKVISIVNVVGSSIARESDEVLYTLAGPEIAVATTKGYSTQLSILYMICIKFAHIRKTISNDSFKEYIESLKNLDNYIEQVLNLEEKVKEIANKYYNVDNAFIIGRGLDYCMSLEFSLKLKEISYIHSEAYAAGELKHGSIALIEKDTVVFGVLTQDELIPKTISNLKEVKARGAKVILIAKEGYENLDDIADDIIFIPKIKEEFISSVAIIPMQLISYYIAVKRGCDVDMPRNLAKSVTVE
ncbi:glutamine--fructose-6-phosphate transaminase (isomerizing) [[Clostridium] colinum]|uniref:glutamine--fructose-6-phosphate transaminase (isomerizing) n=1 Tax=[Clostridium] colinum TaxID=36835 RepID=UPI0020246FCC|nr:glutamine--fructose-6-phosphate transaminase (isomerizing) [[Clostridium] colinum]